MDNQLWANRIEMELDQWHLKEERLAKLFPSSTKAVTVILREKLRYYEGISARYNYTQDPDERLALRVLKQERRRIEKQLYPNLFIRVLHMLLLTPVRQKMLLAAQSRQVEKNSQLLHESVQRAGFNNLDHQLDEQISLGKQQFSIPVSYYVNQNERLDHQLSFIKDQAGQYHFQGYKSSLFNKNEPEEHKQQYFSVKLGHMITIKEAYNLISGRAVEKGGSWLKLDINDKDVQGNYLIKQFNSDYGYGLKDLFHKLPLKELADKYQSDKILDNLRKGDRQSVTFLKDGIEHSYYVEANPQFKSVDIYDEQLRKITLTALEGNKSFDQLKLVSKLTEPHEDSMSKRSNMRIT